MTSVKQEMVKICDEAGKLLTNGSTCDDSEMLGLE